LNVPTLATSLSAERLAAAARLHCDWQKNFLNVSTLDKEPRSGGRQ